MKDIPVIFSGGMVRAMLDDLKTMTRRLAYMERKTRKPALGESLTYLARSPWQDVKVGDRLWVRESWKPHSLYAGMRPKDMPQAKVFYLADRKYEPSNVPGIPSIHMPRWASRITLIVTATKVEPLQSISEDDALAEGVQKRGERDFWAGENRGTDAITAFSALWWSLHGIGSWNANPEVVALTFKVIKANIDAQEARAA
ncbi:hypothetical protein HAP47_0023090 [Bradyrhizobium sp. 41S5]|uniref:hypothetical protein n=1 Tax=Bradyrhizobium sp. 41S5 TaxID=1404443 RepID=UPI00156AC321|nr:hypothetical protein [Bradyrhizobium sp. 41S5]UFX42148.1 hypothetical protein HAP47_0023090 [Bradyrhizobium sp. 41S5]